MRLVEAFNDCIAENRRFFGIEFFPPKSEASVANLYDRMQRLTSHTGPLFCSITSDDATADSSIEIAATAQQVLGVEMQINITGGDTSEENVRRRLDNLKSRGVQNLCVVRGMSSNPPFDRAERLVKFIRAEYGSYFGIAVAGYPEGQNGEDSNLELELEHLKAKVDAGADLIITQMVFDSQLFLKFCSNCREKGITCPILPGIMPIHSYAQFSRRLRCFKGTDKLHEALQAVKNDDAEVQKVALDYTVQFIKQCFRGGVRGVYVYSMNLETPVVRLMEGCGLANQSKRRGIPTGGSKASERRGERAEGEVRPIFWAGRTSSYLARTALWDEFPNGRWGSTQSPAFRNDTTYHTQLAVGAHARHCCKFRQVSSQEDLCTVFLDFLDGHGKLPWAEEELSAEAGVLMDDILRPLNARGFFTINSQPAVNGVSSTNKVVGWGPPNGFVYQKQYLEFFVSPAHLSLVMETFKKYPSLSYMGTDAKKETVVASDMTEVTACRNAESADTVTAVTWGVFPGKEILQPTIVSTRAFLAWAEEAFSLWTEPFDQGVGVPPAITDIQSQWILLNVVDGDYVHTQPTTNLTKAMMELCRLVPALVSTTSSTENTAASTPNSPQTPTTLLPKGSKIPKLLNNCSVTDLQEIGLVHTHNTSY